MAAEEGSRSQVMRIDECVFTERYARGVDERDWCLSGKELYRFSSKNGRTITDSQMSRLCFAEFVGDKKSGDTKHDYSTLQRRDCDRTCPPLSRNSKKVLRTTEIVYLDTALSQPVSRTGTAHDTTLETWLNRGLWSGDQTSTSLLLVSISCCWLCRNHLTSFEHVHLIELH